MRKNKLFLYYPHDFDFQSICNTAIIPAVDSEVIEPKIKIYEPNGITYWCPEIGFNKFTDPNRK